MTRRTIRMTKLLAAAGLLALAGCSRPEPEQPAGEDNVIETMPTADATPEALPSAEPVATPTPIANVADVPPEKPVAPDAQMIEDADATGMTARVSRDDAPAAAGNDAAPQ